MCKHIFRYIYIHIYIYSYIKSHIYMIHTSHPWSLFAKVTPVGMMYWTVTLCPSDSHKVVQVSLSWYGAGRADVSCAFA